MKTQHGNFHHTQHFNTGKHNLTDHVELFIKHKKYTYFFLKKFDTTTSRKITAFKNIVQFLQNTLQNSQRNIMQMTQENICKYEVQLKHRRSLFLNSFQHMAKIKSLHSR